MAAWIKYIQISIMFSCTLLLEKAYMEKSFQTRDHPNRSKAAPETLFKAQTSQSCVPVLITLSVATFHFVPYSHVYSKVFSDVLTSSKYPTVTVREDAWQLNNTCWHMVGIFSPPLSYYSENKVSKESFLATTWLWNVIVLILKCDGFLYFWLSA